MKVKEVQGVQPIQPIAGPKLDQAVSSAQAAQAAQPPGKIATAYNKLTAPVAGVDPNSITQSKLGSAVGNVLGAPASLLNKALTSKTAGRFAAGFTAGAKSGIGAGSGGIQAGAGVRADAAAMGPEKLAFDVFSKQLAPENIPPQDYAKVQQILKGPIPQQKGWAQHVQNKTSPYGNPAAPTSSAPQPVNAVSPKAQSTLNTAAQNNPEVAALLKNAGLLK